MQAPELQCEMDMRKARRLVTGIIVLNSGMVPVLLLNENENSLSVNISQVPDPGPRAFHALHSLLAAIL